MAIAPATQQALTSRLRIFCIIIFFLFTLLFCRLIYLQVIKGKHFSHLSENNRIRYEYLTAPRGVIYDRHGEVLARSRPSFDLELLPDKKNSLAEIFTFLSELLGEERELMEKKYQALNKGRRGFHNRLLYSNLSRDQLALVSAAIYRYPNIQINIIPRREYLYPEINAHLLGYLREIGQTQLDHPDYKGYLAGDRIGQQGLEKVYEKKLQGTRGVRSVTVNAQGQKRDEKLIRPDREGHKLETSVDLLMQQAAYQGLGENNGAVIAMNIHSGEILTLVSKPSFDPNIFNYPLNTEQWQELGLNPERPLNNKAISGTYPPGSIFKIFMSYAGLNEKLIDPEHRVNCPGYFLLNGRTRFNCHKRGGHGVVNLESALAMSCNVYFYELGVKLGVDGIHKHSSELGLGELTGIDLSGETKGLVPSTEWKKKAFKKAEDQIWYPGETPSVAIGQGAVSITPIQIIRALGTLLNGGILIQPTLIKGAPLDQGRILRHVDINPEQLAAIKLGLWSVVNSPRGTGKRASIEKETGIIVAGKTATSQTKSSKNLLGKDSENHAMFIGYAPQEEPEIAIFVLVEHGGHGGVSAAPIAREVLLSYYRNQIKDQNAILPKPTK